MRIDIEITPRAKRAIAWFLLPLVVLVGTIAVAHAVGMNPIDTSWIPTAAQNHTGISSSLLKGNLDDLQSQIAALQARPTSRSAHVVQAGAACVADNQAPGTWATTAKSGLGSCTLTFTPGTFRETPSCVCSASMLASDSDAFCSVDSSLAPSADAVRFIVIGAVGTAATGPEDNEFFVHCISND